MKTSWTAGLAPELTDEMTREFKASALLRERLQTLIEAKIASRKRIAGGVDQYEKASWAYQQADTVGYERALLEIITLISTKDVA